MRGWGDDIEFGLLDWPLGGGGPARGDSLHFDRRIVVSRLVSKCDFGAARQVGPWQGESIDDFDSSG